MAAQSRAIRLTPDRRPPPRPVERADAAERRHRIAPAPDHRRDRRRRPDRGLPGRGRDDGRAGDARPSGDAYVLRVRGDSMIDAHIADGDFVVIRPQSTARNGDIVVAQVEENAVTLKRFFGRRTGSASSRRTRNTRRCSTTRPDPGQAHRGHPPPRLSAPMRPIRALPGCAPRSRTTGALAPVLTTAPSARRARQRSGLHSCPHVHPQAIHRGSIRGRRCSSRPVSVDRRSTHPGDHRALPRPTRARQVDTPAPHHRADDRPSAAPEPSKPSSPCSARS